MTLKQRLNRKLKKNGGFTLIEMLIVVAIIAILVIVSIPMVNSSLDNAREATDAANERAAKGAAVAEYLLDDTNMGKKVGYCYDADKGTALPQDTAGTCNHTADIKEYGNGTTGHGKGHVHVIIDTNGTATVSWSKS